MVGSAAHMHNNSEQLVRVIHMHAVLGGVSQLQLKREHYSVHQLAHPVGRHRERVTHAVIT